MRSALKFSLTGSKDDLAATISKMKKEVHELARMKENLVQDIQFLRREKAELVAKERAVTIYIETLMASALKAEQLKEAQPTNLQELDDVLQEIKQQKKTLEEKEETLKKLQVGVGKLRLFFLNKKERSLEKKMGKLKQARERLGL